jgi:hypothetical protein
MFSETSAEAYAIVMASGVLSKLRTEVYGYIAGHQDDDWLGGGVSRANVKRRFNDTTDSYARRIADLIEMGLIVRAGKKPNDERPEGKRFQVYYHRITKRNDPLPIKKKKADEDVEATKQLNLF